jgi:hypothetical protein
MNKRFAILLMLLMYAVVFFISCVEDAADSKKEIVKTVKDTSVVEELEQLFFVGHSGVYTGVYRYDFNTDNYEMFWSARNESVVKLLYSNDLRYIFFLTARSFGIKNGISFINGIKLYKLIPDLSMVEFIKDIGNAIQIFAYWEDLNFRVQFTSFDLRVATYINRTNQIYSPYGKLIQQTNDVFDFIKNGYPPFDVQTSSPLSPSGKFGFTQNDSLLYFNIIPDQKEFFVDTVKEPITKIAWCCNENYVFITTFAENRGEEEGSSDLIVYKTLSHKLEREWSSNVKINYLLTDKYLIFDLFNKNKSSINIYNFIQFKDTKQISLRNGCGLTAVP